MLAPLKATFVKNNKIPAINNKPAAQSVIKPANLSNALTLSKGKTNRTIRTNMANKIKIQATKAVPAGLYFTVPRIVLTSPPNRALVPGTKYAESLYL